MVNPPKKKGTRFEVYVLEKYLRPIWPGAIRVSNTLGSKDQADFAGTDWMIEAKHSKRWELPEWMRVIIKKAVTRSWGIIMRQDARALPDVIVIPAKQWRDLMIEYYKLKERVN